MAWSADWPGASGQRKMKWVNQNENNTEQLQSLRTVDRQPFNLLVDITSNKMEHQTGICVAYYLLFTINTLNE